MGLWDSVRSTIPVGDDNLTKDDISEMKDNYKNALDICDYMIKWSNYHKRHAEDFFEESNNRIFLPDKPSIMYESDRDENYRKFPDPIKSAYINLKSEFNPRDATTVAEVERCFEEHEQFADKTKNVIKKMLEKLDELENKLKRVKHEEKANKDFEHDGFEHPNETVEDKLSVYVDERVSENSEGSEEESEMENIDTIKLVYFIGEELRKQEDKEYDESLHRNVYNAYPEDCEQVSRELSSHYNTRGRDLLKHHIGNIGSERSIPPLKDEHIEKYILPRVLKGKPLKTPEEIGAI